MTETNEQKIQQKKPGKLEWRKHKEPGKKEIVKLRARVKETGNKNR